MERASILVVEDEPAVRRLLQEFLRDRGFTVREAASGRQALTLIKRSPPALVILDLYMPDCDGVEVLRDIRQHWPKDRPFGVIVLTGGRDKPILETVKALGASHILHKPVDLNQLDQAVRSQLGLDPPPTEDGPPRARS